MAHTIEAKRGNASGAAANSSWALKLVRQVFIKPLEIIVIWQERAEQRHILRSLDSRMLKDIGVSASDANREAGKPFWLP